MRRPRLRQVLLSVLAVLLLLVVIGLGWSSTGRDDSHGNRPPVPSPSPGP